MAKAHRGLDGRHRDKGGKIEKKRQHQGGIATQRIRSELRKGSPHGHDAQDATQGNGIGFIA